MKQVKQRFLRVLLSVVMALTAMLQVVPSMSASATGQNIISEKNITVLKGISAAPLPGVSALRSSDFERLSSNKATVGCNISDGLCKITCNTGVTGGTTGSNIVGGTATLKKSAVIDMDPEKVYLATLQVVVTASNKTVADSWVKDICIGTRSSKDTQYNWYKPTKVNLKSTTENGFSYLVSYSGIAEGNIGTKIALNFATAKDSVTKPFTAGGVITFKTIRIDTDSSYTYVRSDVEGFENFLLTFQSSKYTDPRDADPTFAQLKKWGVQYVKYLTALRNLTGVEHNRIRVIADHNRTNSSWNGKRIAVVSGATIGLLAAIREGKYNWTILHESGHAYKEGQSLFNAYRDGDDLFANIRLICALERAGQNTNILIRGDSGSSKEYRGLKYSVITAEQYLMASGNGLNDRQLRALYSAAKNYENTAKATCTRWDLLDVLCVSNPNSRYITLPNASRFLDYRSKMTTLVLFGRTSADTVTYMTMESSKFLTKYFNGFLTDSSLYIQKLSGKNVAFINCPGNVLQYINILDFFRYTTAPGLSLASYLRFNSYFCNGTLFNDNVEYLYGRSYSDIYTFGL